MKKMYHDLVKDARILLFSITMLISIFANATTCPNATIITGSLNLPSAAITLSCGTTNDITGLGGSGGTACGNVNYMGGNEALYVYTPNLNISGFTVAYNGVSYVGITVFQGCPTSGGICLTSVSGSALTKTTTAISLTAGTTYYIMFDTWPSPTSPCPGTFVLNGTVLPPCTGTPNAGLATITSSVGCPSNSFTLSATGVTSATGLNSQWQNSSTFSGPWSNIAGATATSFATSTTSTTYYRLVSTCTTSALTATSSVVSFSVVNPGPCICNTYPANYASSTGDEDITNVTVGTLNNTSSCATAATGLGSLLNRYGNYSGVISGPSVSKLSSVSFSLTQTSCGSAYNNFFQIYVDWNQDGDWLDTGEQVYSQGASVNGNQTVTGNFIVPITATLGTTRMRVVNIEDVASTTNYAHTAYTYGETEDYCFTVTAAVGCTGTPSTGTVTASSISGCAGGIINLTTSGFTSGAGINYQWSSASSGTGPWTNIVGATATTYSFVSNVGTSYYRLVTTCTTSASSNTTNAVSFTGVSCISTNVPATGSNTINCGTSTKLYDDGGLSSNYSANNNGYTVLNNSGSGIITISGTYLNIESGYDSLTIYSGAGTAGTVLYNYDGSGTMTTFSSTPGQILTIQLSSDGIVQGEGFDMNVIYTNYIAPTPTVSISGTPTICAVTTTSLTASGATTYTWTGLGSTNPLSIIPSAATVYSVTGSACGVNSLPTTYTIAVNANPTITVNNGAICSGGSFTPTLSGAITYSYSSGSGIFSPSSTTSYTIFGMNAAGCTNSVVSTVTVNANPSVNAIASNTLICIGNSAILTASTTATSYTWNTGATTMSISVSPTITTTYTVNVTNITSCSSSAVVTVNVNTCTGIDEQVANGVIIYPNPTNGIINITLSSELTKNSTLEIYDAIGKLIVTEVLSSELNTLNISNLSNGIYSFRVMNNNTMVKFGKLAKQ